MGRMNNNKKDKELEPMNGIGKALTTITIMVTTTTTIMIIPP